MPVGEDVNKWFRASDYNQVRQALYDVRSDMLAGKLFGFVPLASRPVVAGATQILWVRSSDNKILYFDGTSDTVLGAGGGGGGNYQAVQLNHGASLAAQPILNFSTEFTATNNGGATSTDIGIASSLNPKTFASASGGSSGSVTDLLTLTHTAAPGANGIGSGILFKVSNGVPTTVDAAQISGGLSDVAAGAGGVGVIDLYVRRTSDGALYNSTSIHDYGISADQVRCADVISSGRLKLTTDNAVVPGDVELARITNKLNRNVPTGSKHSWSINGVEILLLDTTTLKLNGVSLSGGGSAHALKNLTTPVTVQPSLSVDNVQLQFVNDGPNTATNLTAPGLLPLTGGTLTGAVTYPIGAAATPSINFAGFTSTGFYKPGASAEVAVAAVGVEIARWGASAYTLLQKTVIPVGSAATPSIALTGALTTGVYGTTAPLLGFAVAGAEAATLNATRLTTAGKALVGAASSAAAFAGILGVLRNGIAQTLTAGTPEGIGAYTTDAASSGAGNQKWSPVVYGEGQAWNTSASVAVAMGWNVQPLSFATPKGEVHYLARIAGGNWVDSGFAWRSDGVIKVNTGARSTVGGASWISVRGDGVNFAVGAEGGSVAGPNPCFIASKDGTYFSGFGYDAGERLYLHSPAAFSGTMTLANDEHVVSLVTANATEGNNFRWTGGNRTGMTAGASVTCELHDWSGKTLTWSGSTNVGDEDVYLFKAPTFAFSAGGGNVDDPATLSIDAAPIIGTHWDTYSRLPMALRVKTTGANAGGVRVDNAENSAAARVGLWFNNQLTPGTGSFSTPPMLRYQGKGKIGSGGGAPVYDQIWDVRLSPFSINAVDSGDTYAYARNGYLEFYSAGGGGTGAETVVLSLGQAAVGLYGVQPVPRPAAWTVGGGAQAPSNIIGDAVVGTDTTVTPHGFASTGEFEQFIEDVQGIQANVRQLWSEMAALGASH